MKIPKITDISKWSSWSGDSPKNLRIWKDTGTSYKPILSKIEKIKYVYHGTSLANAIKLLQTGVRSRADDGLNVTTDLGYAMTFASNAVDDDPKTIVAIVAIPTNLIDWKRAQMSDNADDEQNAQILNNIPGSKLKIIHVQHLHPIPTNFLLHFPDQLLSSNLTSQIVPGRKRVGGIQASRPPAGRQPSH